MSPLPPEWSPHKAVWIGFPSAADLWIDDLEPAQDEVAAFARAVWAEGKGERVKLVCANGEAAERAVALKTGAEIHIVPFFDIWLRDTGPLVMIDANGRRTARDYAGNGWGGKYPSPLDDKLAELLCAAEGIEREPRTMILEGGAIDIDGAGLLVTTEQCLLNPNRNPMMLKEEIAGHLMRDFGLSRVLWLGDGLIGDHTDGHVDNLARFVSPGTLALPEAEGPGDPNAAVYADAWARAREWGLKLVPLPSPGRVEQDDGIVAASYMNFYIGNAAVVVPVHGKPNDEAAVKAIAALFPDRVVTGLPTGHLLTGGGSFHCISQQIPA
jgi:agmatine deiminase